MVATFPQASNVFIPNHAATNQLVVDFSRNVNAFAVNQYCQIVPVDDIIGYYLKMTVEEAGRILSTDGVEFAWPDGADAPDDSDGTESHEFLPYRAKRFKFGFRLGDLTVDQATWDTIAQHSAVKAQQCMTFRTQSAVNVLTDAGNYAADHVLDVPNITGNTGNWTASTTARQDIKRSIHTAQEKILDSTLAAVDPADFNLVVSSALAKDMALSQEIVDYIKGSPEALAQVRGELPNSNVEYGLPQRLYGVNVVVEKTRKTTSRKGATRAVEQVMPFSTPVLISRPGELEGLYGSPSFSTVTFFMKEEMTTETLNDVNNRLTRGRIVENYATVMTAPSSGILFTNAA